MMHPHILTSSTLPFCPSALSGQLRSKRDFNQQRISCCTSERSGCSATDALLDLWSWNVPCMSKWSQMLREIEVQNPGSSKGQQNEHLLIFRNRSELIDAGMHQRKPKPLTCLWDSFFIFFIFWGVLGGVWALTQSLLLLATFAHEAK